MNPPPRYPRRFLLTKLVSAQVPRTPQSSDRPNPAIHSEYYDLPNNSRLPNRSTSFQCRRTISRLKKKCAQYSLLGLEDETRDKKKYTNFHRNRARRHMLLSAQRDYLRIGNFYYLYFYFKMISDDHSCLRRCTLIICSVSVYGRMYLRRPI